MLKLPDDLKEFAALLNAHKVRYVVVGGFAVAFHGYPRMTGDIDFFVEATEENARKVIMVLAEFGFGGLGLKEFDFLQPDVIIQLGYPPNRIDLLTSISGVTFEEAWDSKVTVEAGDVTLNFIGKDSLMANKSATGRHKDLSDIDSLKG